MILETRGESLKMLHKILQEATHLTTKKLDAFALKKTSQFEVVKK
jgi:hypothetical protein